MPLACLLAQPALGCKLDPAKLLPGDMLAQNLEHACAAAALYLAAIHEHAAVPRAAAGRVAGTLRARADGVGGFVFMRFFCSAVLAFEGFGVLASLLAGPLRRGLVLVTRCLQSLVNGQLPCEPWAGAAPVRHGNIHIIMNHLLEQFARAAPSLPPAAPTIRRRARACLSVTQLLPPLDQAPAEPSRRAGAGVRAVHARAPGQEH